MSPLNIEDARALLVRIVQGLYDKRHSPVPGALVKAQLIAEAAKQDSAFSEREYGLKNFLEFVKTAPEIAVQIRIGSDMLLAPATAGEATSANVNKSKSCRFIVRPRTANIPARPNRTTVHCTHSRPTFRGAFPLLKPNLSAQ